MFNFKIVHKSKFNPQSGQTLILVIMVMIAALFVGLTTSSRFVSRLHLLSNTDDASKAVGVAEASIERLLVLPASTLDGYINNNNCGSACTLSILDFNGQAITSNVILSHTGNSSVQYDVSLTEDHFEEVSLVGFSSGRSVSICWTGENSIVGEYIYTNSGVYTAAPFAVNSVSTAHPENNFADASANYGYSSCHSVTASNTPIALRIKSVYGKIDAHIVPAAGYSIPVQGIKLVATGKAGKTIKTITVIKSTSFTPSQFDYVLYQKSNSDTLSN